MAVTGSESSVFVSECDVKQAVDALFKVIASMNSKKSKKKELFAEDGEGRIVLNIALKKISTQKNNKILNILVPNPIYSQESTRICFFVKDLVRKESDHDETKIHYKEFLASKGISFQSEIIPLHQLRAEYREHELKQNLCNSYDLFMTDSRLAAYMPDLLGKEFWKKRRFPTRIRMDDKHMKKDIKKTLNSTPLYIHGRGTTFVVQVGLTTYTEKQIEENVTAIVSYIRDEIPGGWVNVRGIYIKTPVSLSIPIYISGGSPNDVVFEFKEKCPELPVIDEVSTLMGDINVAVYPSGHVEVLRKRKRTHEKKTESETATEKGPEESSKDEEDKGSCKKNAAIMTSKVVQKKKKKRIVPNDKTAAKIEGINQLKYVKKSKKNKLLTL